MSLIIVRFLTDGDVGCFQVVTSCDGAAVNISDLFLCARVTVFLGQWFSNWSLDQ